MRKNAIIMVLYEILMLILPLITAPILARTLGPSGVGIYSYTYSIISYFIILCQLGVKLYGRREIAKVSDNIQLRTNVFWSIYTIQFIMMIISILFYVFSVFFIFNLNYRNAMLIQTIALIAAGLDISWFYFGIEKFKVTVTRNFVVKVISFISIVVLINDENDVLLYVFLMAFSNLLSEVVMWFSLRSNIIRISVKTLALKKYLKSLLIFTLPVLSSQLFSVTDKFLLGYLISVEDVGYYENAYKIARIPLMAITTLGTVMLPRISNMVANGKFDESKKYIEKSLILTMILSFGCSFGISSVSSTFIPIYLGKSFTNTIGILEVMSFMIIFIGWGNVFRTQYILPNGYDSFYVKAVIYAAIINIILNIVTIPIWGVYGAVLASIISEFIICIYQSYKIRKEFEMSKLIKVNIKYFISAIIMYCTVKLVTHIVNNDILGLVIQITVGAVIYIIAIIIFELISKEFVIIDEIIRIYRKYTKKNS